MRSQSEMQELLSAADEGDLLLIPSAITNIRYVRMPSFEHAAQVPRHVIGPELARRLRLVYSSDKEYRHWSIPSHVSYSLLKQGKKDVLEQISKSGLTYHFGWRVYQVQARVQ